MSCLVQPAHVQKVSLAPGPRNAPPCADATMTPRPHRPAIVFLTGLSGAGKSTLATTLEANLRAEGVLATVIDGDKLRVGLCKDLGFSEQDRHENIRRATELALHLADIGAVVIVALIAPFRADRALAARRAGERRIAFAEVFIDAPLPVCERRDPKNLYKRARAGEIKSFTGLDSPYEPPTSAALELHTDRETIAQSAEKLTRFTLALAQVSPRASGATSANA